MYKIKEAVEKVNNGKTTVVGDEQELAIISLSDETFLLIEKDGCHRVKDLPETLKVGVAEKEEGSFAIMPTAYIYPTVNHIVNSGAIEFYEIELPEWISYYGIKSRIKDNCSLLKETMFGYKLDVEKYFV